MKCSCDHPEKYGHAEYCVYYEIDRLRGLLREAEKREMNLRCQVCGSVHFVAIASTADQPPVAQSWTGVKDPYQTALRNDPTTAAGADAQKRAADNSSAEK